jgi:hypothetical protein
MSSHQDQTDPSTGAPNRDKEDQQGVGDALLGAAKSVEEAIEDAVKHAIGVSTDPDTIGSSLEDSLPQATVGVTAGEDGVSAEESFSVGGGYGGLEESAEASVDQSGASASGEHQESIPTFAGGSTTQYEDMGAEVSWDDGLQGSGHLTQGSHTDFLGMRVMGDETTFEGQGSVTFDSGVQVAAEVSETVEQELLGIRNTQTGSIEGEVGVDTSGVSAGAGAGISDFGTLGGAGMEVGADASVTWNDGLDASVDTDTSETVGILGARQTTDIGAGADMSVDESGASVGATGTVGTHGSIGSADSETSVEAHVDWGDGVSAGVSGEETGNVDVWGVQGTGTVGAGAGIDSGGIQADVGGSGEIGISGVSTGMGGEVHGDIGLDGAEAGSSASWTVGVGGTDATFGVDAEAGVGGGQVHVGASAGVEGVAEGGASASVGTVGASVDVKGKVGGQKVHVSADTGDASHAAGDVLNAASGAAHDAGNAIGDAADAAGDAASDAGDAVGGAAEDAGDAISDGAGDVADDLGF